MLPPSRSGLVEAMLTGDSLEAYASIANRKLLYHETGMKKRASGGHRLLGHPDPVQTDVEGEAATLAHCRTDKEWRTWMRPGREKDIQRLARKWRLLLQLDSDSNAGMMWGDVGALYFMIPERSLAKGRWEDVQLVLQGG
jgi:hypothetical protein